ncbi:MAG: phosphoribosylformylglycinamidine cyclo-ligase, partial [Deltaproteobacteria bacterium]|nr:phosphoribosylformylglycinamidine cyclo-ligase [Deltaproteobacteria bacterium]MBW2531009.1 phosphoribosylformylglycinamidine cyclo-ligase [Deltaproteobacteria bacterium]
MPISYRDAGVDIDAGNELVRRIGPLARATRTAGVIADVGGFAGLMAVPAGLQDPVLVAGTDGVGTKLAIAFATGVHDTVGIDLVAMCVNDVVTTGAQPLLFLDYFAAGKLDVEVAEAVVRGIARGCEQGRCALLGGETAELPGLYAPGHYDLAGFAVGVVERHRLLPRSDAAPGDALIALPSSGLHSNGYSLARRVLLGQLGLRLEQTMPEHDGTVAEALLRPTRIYARAVEELLKATAADLRGLAHVTGGGLAENVPRVLGPGLAAIVDLDTFERPAIFQVIRRGGPVAEPEMRRTFNLGVGLVAVVAPAGVDRALAALRAAGEQPWVL